MRYETLDNGIIRDNKTGLLWMPSTTMFSRSFGLAEKPVFEDDNFEWRLPTITELTSIIDYTRSFPATDFSGIQSGWYWSSTICTHNPSYIWIVDFDFGIIKYIDRLEGVARTLFVSEKEFN